VGKSPSADFVGTFPLKRGRKGLKQIRLFERLPFKKRREQLVRNNPSVKNPKVFDSSLYTREPREGAKHTPAASRGNVKLLTSGRNMHEYVNKNCGCNRMRHNCIYLNLYFNDL